ncbi:MAG: tetratricopeptide repeat protein [bacterium]
MARKERNPAAETLREMEASGDRIAEWASENAVVILGVIAGILVLAAGVGLWVQHGADRRDAAADALAIATSDYRQAMGADPAGGPIPEPANPDLGRRTRVEFAERFARIGREHGGTAAGSLAWLEAGTLLARLERPEEARESFEAARESAGPRSPITALAWMRLADLAEARGDLAAAAEAYEAAANVPDYPLQANALAEAARTWAAAGEPEKALAVFQRLESEFPDERVPPHIASRMNELRLELGEAD